MLFDIKKTAVLSLLLWLSVACHSLASASELNVLACEPEWASLAKEIGGDKLKIKSATLASQDAHHIQARPSLIAMARRADLLFCTGAELEIGWLPILLRKSANPKIQRNSLGHFLATDHVELKDKPLSLDRSEGDIHADGNPHIHLSPYYILEVAKALKQRLQMVDGENKDYYQARFEAFKARWLKAISRWEADAKQIKQKRVIVHHNSWYYLSDWLGFSIIATLEPKPGIPPTTGHLSKLIKQIEMTPVDMIIHSQYQSARSAKWLSNKTNVPAMALPSTVGSEESIKDLFDLFSSLIERLKG